MRIHDVAIIGGGPSGLALAKELDDAGIHAELYEQGCSIEKRHHNNTSEIGKGIGGAGLFSDGKFSFFPSGHSLYTLESQECLNLAYHKMKTLLKTCKVPTVDLPDLEGSGWHTEPLNDISCKNYQSFYGTLTQRIDIIKSLSRLKTVRINTKSKVLNVNRTSNNLFEVIVDRNNVKSEHYFKTIVFALGKFGPFWINQIAPFIKFKQSRFEFGIRIEYPERYNLFHNKPHPDIKLIWNTKSKICKTFCTCRRGEVVNVEYDGLSSLSGRSDGITHSNYSNFSILINYSDDSFDCGNRVWDNLKTFIKDNKVIYQQLDDFINNSITNNPFNRNRIWLNKNQFELDLISKYSGEELYCDLKDALNIFLKSFPELNTAETTCLFPVVESLGFHPELDNNSLKMTQFPIWFTGDNSGRFRGVVPALVSGFYVGLQIKQWITNNE
jgi:uncharacterized protein